MLQQKRFGLVIKIIYFFLVWKFYENFYFYSFYVFLFAAFFGLRWENNCKTNWLDLIELLDMAVLMFVSSLILINWNFFSYRFYRVFYWKSFFLNKILMDWILTCFQITLQTIMGTYLKTRGRVNRQSCNLISWNLKFHGVLHVKLVFGEILKISIDPFSLITIKISPKKHIFHRQPKLIIPIQKN